MAAWFGERNIFANAQITDSTQLYWIYNPENLHEQINDDKDA